MKRIFQYLKRVLITTLIFVLVSVILYTLQHYFHLFRGVINFINQDFSKVSSTLSAKVLSGISLGGILLVLFITFFPYFMKGIDKKEYMGKVFLGVLSSFVYFISDLIYRYTEKISRFYFLISVAIVIMVTVILVQILSLAVNEKNQVETKTEIVSSIVAGLVFGLVLQLLQVGLDYIRHSVKL